MTRIASGVTDQGFYFVAVDETNFTDREPGLSAFTVVMSRNGGADSTMTTPTVSEIDNTTMTGVYFLLCDEDMTIDSGDVEQEIAFHITCSGMAPVTKTVTLFRPPVTAGTTLGVNASGQGGIDLANIGLPAAGAVPYLGIIDNGTAQSASSTGVVLRAAAAFDDNSLIGSVIAVYGSDQGFWQLRSITDNALSGDTVTVDAWTTTPTGTITYIIFASPPVAAADTTALVNAILDEANSAGNHDTADTVGGNILAASQASGMDAAGIRDAVGLASANLDTQLAALPTDADVNAACDTAISDAALATAAAVADVPTNSELATALAAADDAVLAAIAALNNVSSAEVNAACDTAISDASLATAAAVTALQAKLLAYAQLIARSDAAIATDNATELGEINANGGSGAGSFDNTTDATQAIRDRGDAAWTTGAGGSAPTVEEIRAEIDSNSTQLAAIVEDTGTTLPSAIAALNNVSTAEVNAACDTAISDAALATAANLAVVDGIVDDLKSGIIYGSAATGTLSTTQATTDLTGYADDQLIGRVIVWLSGDCEGEASKIEDYANTGGLLTYTAMTTAPGNGDTFKIV